MAKRVLNPQQEREASILSKSVLKHFQHLQDPRVERTQHHRVVTIVTKRDFGGALRSGWVCRY